MNGDGSWFGSGGGKGRQGIGRPEVGGGKGESGEADFGHRGRMVARGDEKLNLTLALS